MKQFIEKYQQQVTGVLTGGDRLVFRGSLRRLNYGRWSPELEAFLAIGMEQYLSQNSILMKHFGDHSKQISERIKRESLKPFYEQKLPVPFLRSAAADKEAMARKVATSSEMPGDHSTLMCAGWFQVLAM